MLLRLRSPSSSNRTASAYTSSPLAQPATQTRVEGYVLRRGITSSRTHRMSSGSRNMLVTFTPTIPRNLCMLPASCRMRSW